MSYTQLNLTQRLSLENLQFLASTFNKQIL